jgi:hypothetical protein
VKSIIGEYKFTCNSFDAMSIDETWLCEYKILRKIILRHYWGFVDICILQLWCGCTDVDRNLCTGTEVIGSIKIEISKTSSYNEWLTSANIDTITASRYEILRMDCTLETYTIFQRVSNAPNDDFFVERPLHHQYTTNFDDLLSSWKDYTKHLKLTKVAYYSCKAY